MKRIFALMLALLLAASLVACSDKEDDDKSAVDLTVTSSEMVYEAGGDYNDAFYYEYINGDEVAIVGYSGSHVPHDVVLPATIDNRPVTEISARAFNSKTNVTAVTVPEGVLVIGDMAFNECTSLKSITLPATVVTVGDAAFSGCIQLATVTFPAATTEIGKYAFYNCKSLTAVAMPSVTVIPEQAFMKCDRLKSVTWSAAGTEIGDSAFMSCPVLDTISFPTTLTTVGAYAFADCAKLTAPTLAETVTVGANAFYVTPAN